ncbi:hypothetical protein [Bacillus pumilus]|uniref:hypothetical protein n=1 Tax=Bacillus pumilus TaxID=1408 RepID=UPI0011E98F87|nr:hypothetical protein [Bacillus pumilus]TYS40427.1 hypothetical protein FZC68_16595 [Bacillus pumilus]
MKRFFFSKAFLISFVAAVLFFGIQVNKDGATTVVVVNILVIGLVVGIIVAALARLFSRLRSVNG